MENEGTGKTRRFEWSCLVIANVGVPKRVLVGDESQKVEWRLGETAFMTTGPVTLSSGLRPNACTMPTHVQQRYTSTAIALLTGSVVR